MEPAGAAAPRRDQGAPSSLSQADMPYAAPHTRFQYTLCSMYALSGIPYAAPYTRCWYALCCSIHALLVCPMLLHTRAVRYCQTAYGTTV
eukprot:3940233-Rhodomonas_salina.3